MVKLTNVLDHIFPEFKLFFNNRFSQTSLFLLEKYHTPEKMARMNSVSYEAIRGISRGKFSMQRFLKLKEFAANTIILSFAALESRYFQSGTMEFHGKMVKRGS